MTGRALGSTSAAGPFATKEVPEDLQELRQREAAAIGRAASARRLESPVEAVRGALRHDERERERAAEKSWHTAVLLFESPYDQRRLRILNAIFLTLAKRRHSGWISCRDNWPEFGVTIGHTNVDLILDENPKKVAAYNRHQHPGPDPKRAASTLILQAGESVWQDDGAGKLETKIADICAGLIVEGERAYRKGLREAEEQDERWRAYEEKKRQEELARANAERLTALLESGRLLSEAEALRRLIAQVSAAVEAGGVLLEQHELTSWREWAEGQADAVDPIKSGQVAKHLRPPSG